MKRNIKSFNYGVHNKRYLRIYVELAKLHPMWKVYEIEAEATLISLGLKKLLSLEDKKKKKDKRTEFNPSKRLR